MKTPGSQRNIASRTSWRSSWEGVVWPLPMTSALETAVLLARLTGAHIEGIPLWFGVPEFVVAELATAFSIEIYRSRRDEGTTGARKLFETFMREHGVAARSAEEQQRPTF